MIIWIILPWWHTHALTHTPRPWPPEELQRFQPEEEVTFTSGSSMFRFLTKGRPCEALDTNISFKQNESSKTNSTALKTNKQHKVPNLLRRVPTTKLQKHYIHAFLPCFFFPILWCVWRCDLKDFPQSSIHCLTQGGGERHLGQGGQSGTSRR